MPSNNQRGSPVTTIRQVLNDARQQLQPASPSPSVDASALLRYVLDCSASHLIAWPDEELSSEQLSLFSDVLQQRLQGKPVAYITGEKEFWSLSLKVNSDVLIPRPETETLVEFVLDHFSDREQLSIADLGTGSGAIACALASERPQWHITATDASAAALAIARINLSSYRLENIELVHGRWFEPLEGRNFDLIISNPPYVASNDPHLDQGDIRFEPEAALTSGASGLDAISHLAELASDFLKTDGWLVVEHGYDQQQAVHACFEYNGFDEIIQLNDLAGQPRLTAGQNTSKA